MTFDLDIWDGNSPSCCLGQVWRSRSQVMCGKKFTGFKNFLLFVQRYSRLRSRLTAMSL